MFDSLIFLLLSVGATAVAGSYYGAATGPINMDEVVCTGLEANLTQCTFTSNERCDHTNDAGVRSVITQREGGTMMMFIHVVLHMA